MDLWPSPSRITGMPKLAIIVLLAAGYLAAAPPAIDASATRVDASAGISIRVPHGWHLIRRRLTDVIDPVPRLAVASFAVRLARHSCECGLPNVRGFPRAGAFLFMWEYPTLGAAQLRRFLRRPARFRVAQDNPHWYECAGPSWGTVFSDSGRALQVEVYLGPAAGRDVRARMDAMLNSLRVARPNSS
jgi:hypothetical protein